MICIIPRVSVQFTPYTKCGKCLTKEDSLLYNLVPAFQYIKLWIWYFLVTYEFNILQTKDAIQSNPNVGI